MKLMPLLVYKYNEFLKDHNELESFDDGMNLKDTAIL